MDFCGNNNCLNCCKNAKIQLIHEDINNIVLYGYYDAYFVDENNGVKTLSTREDGSCVFLNQDTGVCDVYQSRPSGCRFRPYLINEHQQQPTIDEDCKFSNEYQVSPSVKENANNIFEKLKKEVAWRRKTGYY